MRLGFLSSSALVQSLMKCLLVLELLESGISLVSEDKGVAKGAGCTSPLTCSQAVDNYYC